MNKRLHALVLSAFALLATAGANAALVTSLPSVTIDGVNYTVTFHTSTTFNQLWDLDNDRAFTDNDGSVFNALPTFWGNTTGGQAAVDAIINSLGTEDWVDSYASGSGTVYTDAFSVPVGWGPASLADKAYTFRDRYGALDNENLEGEFIVPETQVKTFATFNQVSSVPLPAAFWLFGSAVLGLAGVARRKA